ncbi:MAG: hypothetical protein V4574_12445 [Pseudomonadota bacterium]
MMLKLVDSNFLRSTAIVDYLSSTRSVHHGESLSPKVDKVANHMMDMHLAALGTFFGGILSNDQPLMDVHREARYLSAPLGFGIIVTSVSPAFDALAM